MGLFSTSDITKRDGLHRIQGIREQITVDELKIKELEQKKHLKWLEIKDFGTTDAVHAEKGHDYMAKLHREIMKLKKAIVTANKKILSMEEGIKEVV